MHLKVPYISYTSVIPSHVCDRIVDHGEQSLIEAKTNKKQHVRKSEVAWLDDEWIYNSISPFIYEANKSAGWNWKIEGGERIQFTKYGIDQFYDWHVDGGSDFQSTFLGGFLHNYDTNSVFTAMGNVRKISVTINLVDGTEYEGGNLEFDFGTLSGKDRIKICEEIKPKGSIIVFPSFLPHRVSPITKGTRYSLVLWSLGPPWQ